MAQQSQEMIQACSDASAWDLVLSLRARGYCLDHLSWYSEALTVSLEALDLANQLGDLSILPSLENLLGSIYWHLADFS